MQRTLRNESLELVDASVGNIGMASPPRHLENFIKDDGLRNQSPNDVANLFRWPNTKKICQYTAASL